MPLATQITTVGRVVVREVRKTEVPFLAASIAYYAFVALIPLLVLAFVVATVLVGPEFAERLVELTQGFLTPSGQEVVADVVLDAAGRGGASLVSLGLLLWGGLKLFRGLDVAFSMAYNVEVETGFLAQLANAIAAFLAVVLAVVGVLLLGTALAILPEFPVTRVTAPLIGFVAMTIVFLPLYYFLPGVSMSVREALPGTLFAAFGWTLLHALFGVYTANAGQYGVYGAIGVVLLLLTWLYVGAMVLVVGAIVNDVLAEWAVAPVGPPAGDNDLLSALADADEPVLTTSEIAERLPMGRRAVLERLHELYDDGRVGTKLVESEESVWWIVGDRS